MVYWRLLQQQSQQQCTKLAARGLTLNGRALEEPAAEPPAPFAENLARPRPPALQRAATYLRNGGRARESPRALFPRPPPK